MIRRGLRTVVLALAAFVVACSDSPSNADPGHVLTIVAGDAQQGDVSQPLANPLVVRVTDEGGNPVQGVTVTWTPQLGGGAASPGTSVTNVDGRAQTSFIMGAAAGPHTMRATVPEGTGPVTFTAAAQSAQPNPTPQLMATVGVPANYGIHDTFVRDGYAFLCIWNTGVRIYDVGNGSRGGSPGNPVLVSSIVTATSGVPGGPQAHNAWWFHNPVRNEKRYLFVGQEGPGTVGASSSGDIHVVDVSNLAAPVEVATLHVPGSGVHNFWMDEARQVLYAAYYDGGVIAVDVSGTLTGDISGRIIAQRKPGGDGNTFVWGVMLAGNTLYASDMLSGFWALDPLTLATRGGGNNDNTRFTSDLWVANGFGYTGGWHTRQVAGNEITAWSLANPSVPERAGGVAIANVQTVSDVAVTPNGQLLVATAETGGGGGIYVYSLANKAAPVLRGSVLVTGGLHTGEVAVINGRTYVFTAQNPPNPALRIYDITGAYP